MRSIRMSCRLTGAYAGIEPTRLTDRMFDATFGRSYFRRWSKNSLAALEDACRSAPQAAGGS